MEQADCLLADELELDDDGPISETVAERVREHASAGCLICALEEWDDE